MRLLAFTNLFPNAAEPARGLFNLQSFQALARHCDGFEVAAPVRWVPRRFRCGDPNIRIPRSEIIGGLRVHHPGYVLLPKYAVGSQGWQMDTCTRGAMDRIHREFQPDLLYGTWAFPDLPAAAAMARRWGIPLAAKVHGADINLFAHQPARRPHILRALNQAQVILSVTDALRAEMVELGVPGEKILVQRNGVDQERFTIEDRASARKELGVTGDGFHIAYIGTFRVTKGLDVLLEAMRLLTASNVPVTLHLAGDGPQLQASLEEQARASGVADRVRFQGYQSHDRVPRWLAAADVLCLPSRSDGCPNIILEALACGRPVVASRVGGIPEILTDDIGELVSPDDAADLARGIRAALERAWDPESLRASILARSWAKNAAEFYERLSLITTHHCHGNHYLLARN